MEVRSIIGGSERISIVIFVFLVGLIFFSPLVSSERQSAKLDSFLNRMVLSDDVAFFADSSGVLIEGDKIRVVIELNEDAEGMSDEYGIVVETSYGNLVQGLVSVDKLKELSEERGVRLIRVPAEPALNFNQPQETETTLKKFTAPASLETAKGKSGLLAAATVIIFSGIILFFWRKRE